MIINAQARPYRCQVGTVGKNRATVARPKGEMSPALRRAAIIALCTALFLVIALGQVLHRQIVDEIKNAEQLASDLVVLETEQSNLLAQRARLLSSQHIEAVAAVRLDLHVPGKKQIHKL